MADVYLQSILLWAVAYFSHMNLFYMPLFLCVDFHFVVIIIIGTLDQTLFIAIQTKYTVKLFDGLPKCIRPEFFY